MSSEADPTDTSSQLPSVDSIQHKSKLVRSASDNCNLAHSWAKDKSVKEVNSVQTSLTRLLSSSISLQEIASGVFGYLSSTAVVDDESLKSDTSSTARGSLSPVCNPTLSKQHDVHIPCTVFEDKEASLETVSLDITDQNATPMTEPVQQGTSQEASKCNRGRQDGTEMDSKSSEERGSHKEVEKYDVADSSSFFFWDQEEAKKKQVEQIGASACGATAILNVMNVLDLHPDLEVVANAVQTNLRADDAPLPEYLFSRSVAGATHEALIEGLEKSTNGSVYARFFAFSPKRKLDLKQWLVSWMRLGVVPLATLNLQATPVNAEGDVHDAWHHQMIYGVDQDGVYMCNPIVMETYDCLQPQLCSDAILLVRRFDVLKRWHKNTNLSSLALHTDLRWRDMDVLGQAVDMLLDDPPTKPDSGNPEADETKYEKELTDWFMRCHVSIPAAYTSGITLIVRKDNKKGYSRLMEATDLLLEGE